MLATFCLRLAWGLASSLLILTPAQVNVRFYQTHFQIVLGLVVLAALLTYPGTGFVFSVLAAVLAFTGSLSWALEGAPGGRSLIVLTSLFLTGSLLLDVPAEATAHEAISVQIDNFTSAALVGSALTAMLMGHSYLMMPSMSLTPLLRLLIALFVSLGLRLSWAGLGGWFWTQTHPTATLEGDTVFWLIVRWGVGFGGPLIFGVMAWLTAKLRSTQSATGILYVVVICCFLGELTSQLLFRPLTW